MSIRKSILMLSVGIVVPLAVAGLVVETRRCWIDLRVIAARSDTVIPRPADAQALRTDFHDTIPSTTRRRNSRAAVAGRTRVGGHPVSAVADPVEGGGAVVARLICRFEVAGAAHLKPGVLANAARRNCLEFIGFRE